MAYGRPGVYITETLLPAPITSTGTATAAAAAIGRFSQGPTTVTRVTSWYNFVKVFGDYNYAYPATFGVAQFFKNGGTELYVRRVLAATATFAAAGILSSTGTAVGNVIAKNPGADGNNLRILFTARLDNAGAPTGYYDLVVYKENGTNSGSVVDDLVLETFLNVKLTNTIASGDYIVDVVNNNSQYINIVIATPGTSIAPVTTLIILGATGTSAGTTASAGSGVWTVGIDGTLTSGIAALPDAAAYSTAQADFTAINRPLVVFAPEILNDNVASPSVATSIIANLVSAALANDWFVVLDTLPGLTAAQALAAATAVGRYSNVAVYYPNVYVADPIGRSGALRKVGPAGSVVGAYLSTDAQTGPFKAPAGIRQALGGVAALEVNLSSTDLDNLNSSAFPVNAIRAIPGTGIVIMGARTLQQDNTPNRYVNTRRSLIHIKRSLQSITQFALFEGNDPILWSRLNTAIGVFLDAYRNKGGLSGSTGAEAFFVKVDAENNTPTTIANGEVHIEVGVALEYPAEFIVINLSQKTSN